MMHSSFNAPQDLIYGFQVPDKWMDEQIQWIKDQILLLSYLNKMWLVEDYILILVVLTTLYMTLQNTVRGCAGLVLVNLSQT